MKKCDTEHTQSSHFLQETWKEVNEFSFGPIYIGCELVGYVFFVFSFSSFSSLWDKVSADTSQQRAEGFPRSF